MKPRYNQLIGPATTNEFDLDQQTFALMVDIAKRGLTVDEFIHAACSRLLADPVFQNRLRYVERDSLGQRIRDQQELIEAVKAGLWPPEPEAPEATVVEWRLAA